MILDIKQTVPLTLGKDGTICVKGTRLPVERIIYAYQQGEIPESIYDSFPSPNYSVADIYAIIGYYLSNKAKFDKYLAKREREAETVRKQIESLPNYQTNSKSLREKLLAKSK